MNANKAGATYIMSFAIFITIIISLYTWYSAQYLWQTLPNARRILENADTQHRNLSQELKDIINLYRNNRSRASSVVISTLSIKSPNPGYKRWHLNNFLWLMQIHFFFSKNDIFTLWCEVIPYGEGIGLNNAANHYYQKNLDELSLEEATMLIVISGSPSYYLNHSEKLQEKVKILLSKYEKMKNANECIDD